MRKEKLVEQIRSKKSCLIVGLDTDINRIPEHLKESDDPIFEFNRQIINATAPHCVGFKPNIAFYEAHGVSGWRSLQRTVDYINENFPDHFTIADAKRGDIGNTSRMYAKAFLQDLHFDSVTVAPYMGSDSVEPFLDFEDKWAILLALTSNGGAFDFQTQITDGEELYKKVIEVSKGWNGSEKLMYVVGATKAEYLSDIRKRLPDAFFLVPGVGSQGGSLEDVMRNGMNDEVGLLINSSRGIIYASDDENFAGAAATEAKRLAEKMAEFID